MTDQPIRSVLNLTGHVVRAISPDGVTADIPPSGHTARCTQDPDTPAGTINIGHITVPIVISQLSAAVTGLPEHEPGVLLIVSRVVAAAQPHRRDLAFPYDIVRDESGHPLGCRTLAQVPQPPRR